MFMIFIKSCYDVFITLWLFIKVRICSWLGLSPSSLRCGIAENHLMHLICTSFKNKRAHCIKPRSLKNWINFLQSCISLLLIVIRLGAVFCSLYWLSYRQYIIFEGQHDVVNITTKVKTSYTKRNHTYRWILFPEPGCFKLIQFFTFVFYLQSALLLPIIYNGLKHA